MVSALQAQLKLVFDQWKSTQEGFAVPTRRLPRRLHRRRENVYASPVRSDSSDAILEYGDDGERRLGQKGLSATVQRVLVNAYTDQEYGQSVLTAYYGNITGDSGSSDCITRLKVDNANRPTSKQFIDLKRVEVNSGRLRAIFESLMSTSSIRLPFW